MLDQNPKRRRPMNGRGGVLLGVVARGNLGAANLDINIIISHNFLDSFPFAFIEKNNGMASIIESIAHTYAYTQNLVLYDKKGSFTHLQIFSV